MVKVKSSKTVTFSRYFHFCNVLHLCNVWPSVLIQSTDTITCTFRPSSHMRARQAPLEYAHKCNKIISYHKATYLNVLRSLLSMMIRIYTKLLGHFTSGHSVDWVKFRYFTSFLIHRISWISSFLNHSNQLNGHTVRSVATISSTASKSRKVARTYTDSNHFALLKTQRH